MQLPLFPGADTDVSPAITLAAYAERWLATASAPPYVAVYTTTMRRYRLARYVLPTLGNRPLGSITRADMAALQSRMFALGYAYATVRGTIIGMLGPLFAEAKRDGLIAEIPTRGLRWPREPHKAPDPYEPAEVERILGWFRRREPQWVPFVSLVFLAGARPSEAAALRWEDYDSTTGALRIARAMVDGQPTRTKTVRSVRTIYVCRRLRSVLDRERGRLEELVVTDRWGKPIKTHKWGTDVFRRACEKIGVPYLGFYKGRHGFISRAAERAPLPHIASYCGTSVKVIEAAYLRWMGGFDSPLDMPPIRQRKSRLHRTTP